MIEQQVSKRMHDAVLDEPPLGFDPDDTVNRAVYRQRRRRRVAATLATTVAAVAAVAGVGILADRDQRTNTPAVSSAGQPTPTPTCPDQPSHALLPAVPALLAEHAPTTRFGEPRALDSDTADPARCGGLVEAPFAADDLISVWLYNVDVYTTESAYSLRSETTLPDDTVVREYVHQDDSDGSSTAVTHLRADGWVGIAFSSDDTVVTVDQLTAIATDPRLTF